MLIKGQEFTIGADPELFICNGKQPVSAWGMVPGSKNTPHPVKDGAVQVDGMALEYNIDPCTNKEQFVSRIKSVQDQLKEMVSGYEIWEFPTANFEHSHFDEQPFEAKELGCEPDFNAYTGEEQPKPNADSYTRTAGGHIHIGGFPTDDIYSSLHMARCRKLAYHMDLYVGAASLLWDDDEERRKMYGKWGSFRPKPYGMEYRSLSNKWIFNERITELVFELTRYSIEVCTNSYGNAPNSSTYVEQTIDSFPKNYGNKAHVGLYYGRSMAEKIKNSGVLE